MIIFEAFALLATYLLLTLAPAKSLDWMIVMEVFYGLSSASSVAYYSYFYKVFKKEEYQSTTSLIRASILISHLISAGFGQLIVSFTEVPIIYLWYITIGFLALATFTSFLFPSDEEFKASKELTENNSSNSKNAFKLALFEFKDAAVKSFCNWETVMWALLWATLWSTLMGVQGFAPNLWYESDSNKKYLNGLMDALGRGCGVVGALIPSSMNSFLGRGLHFIITLSLIIIVCLILIQSLVQQEAVMYGSYILFVGMTNFANTIISSRLAISNKNAVFAFVFGMSMMLALGMQTLINVICSASGFSVIVKFYVFAGLVSFMTIIYLFLYRFKVKKIIQNTIEIDLDSLKQ